MIWRCSRRHWMHDYSNSVETRGKHILLKEITDIRIEIFNVPGEFDGFTDLTCKKVGAFVSEGRFVKTNLVFCLTMVFDYVYFYSRFRLSPLINVKDSNLAARDCFTIAIQYSSKWFLTWWSKVFSFTIWKCSRWIKLTIQIIIITWFSLHYKIYEPLKIFSKIREKFLPI